MYSWANDGRRKREENEAWIRIKWIWLCRRENVNIVISHYKKYKCTASFLKTKHCSLRGHKLASRWTVHLNTRACVCVFYSFTSEEPAGNEAAGDVWWKCAWSCSAVVHFRACELFCVIMSRWTFFAAWFCQTIAGPIDKKSNPIVSFSPLGYVIERPNP